MTLVLWGEGTQGESAEAAGSKLSGHQEADDLDPSGRGVSGCNIMPISSASFCREPPWVISVRTI